MKCALGAILFLIPLTVGGLTTDFNFEFGVDRGDVVYTKEGSIYLFQPITTVDIPVPPNIMITYVKVSVNALSSPKVDYDSVFRRVSIKYSWIQVTQSSYSIVVKGVAF